MCEGGELSAISDQPDIRESYVAARCRYWPFRQAVMACCRWDQVS